MEQKNTRQIIAENLITLRKQHKLTQNDLAKKLSYSDNMISRWERAEISPSIETLEKISEFYNIPIENLFKENVVVSKQYEKDLSLKNFCTLILLVLSLWSLIITTYVYYNSILDKRPWLLFIAAIPLSCLILLPFKGRWGTPVYRFVLYTIINWSVLIFLYLALIQYNIVLIFLIGIPTQLSLVVKTFIKPRNSLPEKKRH